MLLIDPFELCGVRRLRPPSSTSPPPHAGLPEPYAILIVSSLSLAVYMKQAEAMEEIEVFKSNNDDVIVYVLSRVVRLSV